MKAFTVPKMKQNSCTTDVWHQYANPHKHTDWEFTTVLVGKAVNIVNGVEYDAPVGSFFLLGPPHMHEQVAMTKIERRDVCISEDLFIRCCNDIKEGFYEQIVSIKKPIIIHPQPEVCANIIERLRNLDVYKAQDEQYGRSVLYSIIVYLLGLYIEKERESDKNIPQFIVEFIEKLHKPEYFSKRVQDFVDSSNYSHAHFLSLFKKYTGKSLIDYVAELRMAYAANLLVSTNKSVVEVANEVGYDNHSFFTMRFKERYGVTPKKYRMDNR